jgi:hypothetical protein
MSANEEAEKAGIDISLLEENLRLSYQQRVEQHQLALGLALQLEAAGKEIRGESKTTS